MSQAEKDEYLKKLLGEEDNESLASDSEDDDWLPTGHLPHNSRNNEYFAESDNEEESDHEGEFAEHADSENKCQNEE